MIDYITKIIQGLKENPAQTIIFLFIGCSVGYGIHELFWKSKILSPSTEFNITIDSPKNGETLKSYIVEVRGKAYNNLPVGRQLWLVVKPRLSPDQKTGFYPVGDGPISLLASKDNVHDWKHSATIGLPNQTQAKFEVMVVLTDASGSKSFQQYMNDCKTGKGGCFVDPSLPDNTQQFPSIEVLR